MLPLGVGGTRRDSEEHRRRGIVGILVGAGAARRVAAGGGCGSCYRFGPGQRQPVNDLGRARQCHHYSQGPISSGPVERSYAQGQARTSAHSLDCTGAPCVWAHGGTHRRKNTATCAAHHAWRLKHSHVRCPPCMASEIERESEQSHRPVFPACWRLCGVA